MNEATFPIAEALISILGIFAAALLAVVFYIFRDLIKRIATTNSILEEHRKETKAEFDKVNNKFDKVNDQFGELRKETKAEFDKVNDKFDKVNDKFDKVNERIGELKATTAKEIGELKATTAKEIGELRGMTSVLLSRRTGTAGEDESAGPPEAGGWQEETPEQQVETPTTEIGLVRQQRKTPNQPAEDPEQPAEDLGQVTENSAISGESTDRGTQAIARSEAN